jgi:hypothetical protein
MAKYICLLLTLACGLCHAQENAFTTGVQWLKQSLPQSMKVEFNKSRIKFKGCKHREYELNFFQPMTENITLQAGVSYAKGQLNWGVNNQKISLQQYSVLPRYTVSDNVSVSGGVVLQSAPEFKTSQGVELILPRSKIYKLTTRFVDERQEHQLEVEVSSHHWNATGEFGSLFANGLVDNKVGVSYTALF